jgi:hypothetical protein
MNRPYFLLGGRRLAAISERIHQALDAIARDWCREPYGIELIEVSALESAASGMRAARFAYFARDGEAWIGLIAADVARGKLAEQWLGCEVAKPGLLVETLEREFCKALFVALRAKGGTAAVVAPDGDDSARMPSSALRAGAGTAVVEIEAGGIPMMLVVSADVWPELLDVPMAPCPRPLSQAVAAISNAPVRIEARFPAVEMPLSEVGALAPGDFVDLQLDLTGAVRVVSSDIDLGLDAVLGKRAGLRAIQFSAHSVTNK